MKDKESELRDFDSPEILRKRAEIKEREIHVKEAIEQYRKRPRVKIEFEIDKEFLEQIDKFMEHQIKNGMPEEISTRDRFINEALDDYLAGLKKDALNDFMGNLLKSMFGGGK